MRKLLDPENLFIFVPMMTAVIHILFGDVGRATFCMVCGTFSCLIEIRAAVKRNEELHIYIKKVAEGDDEP